jgi:hypothetical protein
VHRRPHRRKTFFPPAPLAFCRSAKFGCPQRAVVIAAAVGVGFQLLNARESARTAPGASVATFVGSETCAGCHQAEADRWRSSQHKLATQHATDTVGARQFKRCRLRLFRCAVPLLPLVTEAGPGAGTEMACQDRGPRMRGAEGEFTTTRGAPNQTSIAAA